MRADPLGYLTTELEALKQQGLYRTLRVLEGEQKAHTTFDHRQVVNLSSNNYLGLTTHPLLRERALEATRRLGVGSGSVRSIAGTMDIHMELERRLVLLAHGSRRRVSERICRERRQWLPSYPKTMSSSPTS
jgi:glycine C-acetyltransferase